MNFYQNQIQNVNFQTTTSKEGRTSQNQQQRRNNQTSTKLANTKKQFQYQFLLEVYLLVNKRKLKCVTYGNSLFNFLKIHKHKFIKIDGFSQRKRKFLLTFIFIKKQINFYFIKLIFLLFSLKISHNSHFLKRKENFQILFFLLQLKLSQNNIMLRILASIKSYSYALNVPKYLMDQNLCTLQTEISKIQKLSHSILVFCKQTIFHPQGGGQPDDKGLLKIQELKCQVSILKSHKISTQNGSCNIVYEIPYNEQTSKLQQKMKITMLIDTQFRLKMKKIHTAGHILDLAMKQLIKQLSYGACGHYPDNSFVQYYINKNEIKKDLFQLKAELQKKIIEITNKQINIQRQVLSPDEAIQRNIIQNKSILKRADYVRIIKIGESWCCCGGTHLNNTFQLKDSLKIKKIINKEKTPEKISIKYEVF